MLIFKILGFILNFLLLNSNKSNKCMYTVVDTGMSLYKYVIFNNTSSLKDIIDLPSDYLYAFFKITITPQKSKLTKN